MTELWETTLGALGLAWFVSWVRRYLARRNVAVRYLLGRVREERAFADAWESEACKARAGPHTCPRCGTRWVVKPHVCQPGCAARHAASRQPGCAARHAASQDETGEKKDSP